MGERYPDGEADRLRRRRGRYARSSVAISGDRIVAGAQDATVGANADQGAVYVFVEPRGGWVSTTDTAKLTASDGAAGDLFGWWVAASGDTIAGAAPGASDAQGATYVFGCKRDAVRGGALYHDRGVCPNRHRRGRGDVHRGRVDPG